MHYEEEESMIAMVQKDDGAAQIAVDTEVGGSEVEESAAEERTKGELRREIDGLKSMFRGMFKEVMARKRKRT